MVATSRKSATAEDLLDDPNWERLELFGGEIVERAIPSADHSLVETKLAAAFDPFNRRAGGPRGPGGWWVFVEIHTRYSSGELYCHDVAGWRRERMPMKPQTKTINLRPDWVCEVVSPKHELRDHVTKPRTLHAAEVPHYWIIDPEEKVVLVHRWSKEGYVVVQRATSGETVRAEPFEAIELHVDELFGDDELRDDND
ncbi:MAG TPA: Uma2 family endonuclease [Kofleriaceae bacterium]|jgi:Uma2 family endonuclease